VHVFQLLGGYLEEARAALGAAADFLVTTAST
jgi:hypothetical protein